MPNIIAALTDINIPPHVKVIPAQSLDDFIHEDSRRSFLSNANRFFGTAFIQGERLQFTTAMPVRTMLACSSVDRSEKRASIDEALEHSNRPQDALHAKDIRKYLEETACIGEKFILPAFTFNYGVAVDDNSPDITLMLYVGGGEETNTWPAILVMPQGAELDTTDGAHRRGQFEAILNDPKTKPEVKKALLRNAVDVKIVFEANRSDSHQDFADCGKAKPIADSMVTSYDVRDHRNRRSVQLTKAVPFLRENVDASASNVNLSAKSLKVWSMSAVRMFVGHVVSNIVTQPAGEFALSEPQSKEQQRKADIDKVAGAEEFFEALVRHHPDLRAIAAHEKTAATLRAVKGGNISLRGAGMAIFARAFVTAKVEGISLDDMAAALGALDWSVLKGDVAMLGDPGDGYSDRVRSNANPVWLPMIATTESRYRISTASVDTDKAWQHIRQVLLPSLLKQRPMAAE